MGLFVSAGETGRMLRGRDGKHLIKKKQQGLSRFDRVSAACSGSVHRAFMEMWLQLH